MRRIGDNELRYGAIVTWAHEYHFVIGVKMIAASTGIRPVLARKSLTSDPWGRYYTTPVVSQSLIDRIKIAKPKLVLELGSGAGSLCAAAATRWQDAHLVTVDVDRSSSGSFDAGNVGTDSRHTHFVHDALDPKLSEMIGLTLSSVDVAICNPPYIRPRWRSDFGRILEDARLSGTLVSVHDAGAELLFLAQSLRLLRDNGKLGLILPDGLITAERFSGVREALLRQHRVEQVVQLPRRVFKGTEAQTYLVVLSKNNGETNRVMLRSMESDGKFSFPIMVPQDAAAKRLDFAFHAQGVSSERRGERTARMPVQHALTDLVRGTVCSSSISTFPAPVFHLGDFPKSLGEDVLRIVPKAFALSKRAAVRVSGNARLALPGDILLARVGRALEDRLALVVHGPCVISDCIFALRAKDEHRERLYRFFQSHRGRQSLATSAHGVAARFLSKTNLFEIQF